jgi:hypothetical protein
MWSTVRWGPWGTWQHRSSPLGEARPGPRGSAGAHMVRKVRSGAEEHVAASELSSRGGRVRSHGTRGSAGAHLGREVRSGVAGHVAAPEPTSARRCGLKLQLMWQHVDARHAPCLELELVCGVPGLHSADRGPWVHFGRGCEPTGGANFLAPRSVILIFLLGSRRRAPGRCRS